MLNQHHRGSFFALAAEVMTYSVERDRSSAKEKPPVMLVLIVRHLSQRRATVLRVLVDIVVRQGNVLSTARPQQQLNRAGVLLPELRFSPEDLDH